MEDLHFREWQISSCQLHPLIVVIERPLWIKNDKDKWKSLQKGFLTRHFVTHCTGLQSSDVRWCPLFTARIRQRLQLENRHRVNWSLHRDIIAGCSVCSAGAVGTASCSRAGKLSSYECYTLNDLTWALSVHPFFFKAFWSPPLCTSEIRGLTTSTTKPHKERFRDFQQLFTLGNPAWLSCMVPMRCGRPYECARWGPFSCYFLRFQDCCEWEDVLFSCGGLWRRCSFHMRCRLGGDTLRNIMMYSCGASFNSQSMSPCWAANRRRWLPTWQKQATLKSQ